MNIAATGRDATAKVLLEMFAGAPQVSQKTFWRLREPRKCLGKLFGVCGSPASLSRNFLVFAGVPQVSRETFWCLRESRKSLGKLFGACGSPASLSRNFLVFAEVPQVSRKTFWRLRESRKRKCFFRINHRPTTVPMMAVRGMGPRCRESMAASGLSARIQ